MKIAKKIKNGTATVEEIKYLLYLTLIALEPTTDFVDADENERFSTSKMLDHLDDEFLVKLLKRNGQNV